MTNELESLAGDLLADTAVEKMITESAYMSNILKKQGADVKKQLIQKEMDESIKNSQLRLKKAFRSTAYALKSNDQ